MSEPLWMSIARFAQAGPHDPTPDHDDGRASMSPREGFRVIFPDPP